MKRVRVGCVLLVLVAGVSVATAATRPVGGGILDAGLEGAYFANPDLAGEPAFTRKDIRVQFDWGTVLPVAGSTSPGMKDFPTDGFSARWQGRIMPRFSETYTFTADFDEGLRWWIRPEGDGTWTELVDAWNGSGRESKTFKMAANKAYETKIEYRDLKGEARLRLLWSSPSTPEEPIDCASMNANGGTAVESTIHADKLRCVSPWGAKMDKEIARKLPLENWGEDGWYDGDFDPGWVHLRKGRYLLRFAGLAEVQSNMSRFRVGDQTYDKVLPHGAGYDPETNFTTAELERINPEDTRPDRWLFKDSQRDADAPKGSGVRDIRLMRPVTPGATEYHHPDEVVNRTVKAWLDNYTNLRFYRAIGANRWDLRTRPGEYDHMAASALRNEENKALGGGKGYGCLEDYLRYANELGRDLYLTVNGHNPDHEYLVKLAQAIRYGTDGDQPYTKPTANPVYRPLNPNLRIFMEFSNEIWNYWAGGAMALCKAAVQRGDADGQILNYDGQCPPDGDYRRWQALKTVQMSNAFREVFGDEAMGDRVRVLVFGQYDNTWVLTPVLQFIDNYWNNGYVPEGKSANVPDPHPVNYFIWGGGGATYYANNNPTGRMDPSPLQDGSFETIDVKPGQVAVAPSGSAWQFAGPAGIANIEYDRAPTIRRKDMVAETADTHAWRGVKFVVGDRDLYITELGRLMFPSDKDQTARMAVTDENGKPIHNFNIGGIRIRGWQGRKLPEDGEYRYASLGHRLASGKSMSTVAKLEAGKTYYLLTDEPEGARTIGLHPVTVDAAIRVEAAVVADASGSRGGPGNIRVVKEGAFAMGGGDLHFKVGGFAIGETTGMPPLAETRSGIEGKQVLLMAPGGSVRQAIDFPRADVYALNWVAGTKIYGDNSQDLPLLELYLDGEKVGKTMHANFPGMADGSSEVFTIDAPGKHTVEIRAVPHTSAWRPPANTPVFLDRINLAGISAFFGLPDYSTFPNAGEADGEIRKDWYKRNVNAVNMVFTYGLESSSYEGGWALGGDFIRSPFMHYVNFGAPEAAGAEERMLDIWTTLGGWDFQRHYAQVPEGDVYAMARGAEFPLVKGVIHHNRRLPLLPGTPGVLPDRVPQNGNSSPAVLTCSNMVFAAGVEAGGEWESNPARATPHLTVIRDPEPRTKEMRWMSWNVIAQETGDRDVTVYTTGEGDFKLLYRETDVIAEGPAGQPASGRVKLTQGIHNLKLVCTRGALDVEKIEVK